MNEEERLEKIKESIHYPDCWDTWAYPTVYDAVDEVLAGYFVCQHEYDGTCEVDKDV